MFKHPLLTDDEVYAAYRRVNRIFFSWGNIARRWWSFVRKQSLQEPFPQFVLKVMLTSFIYLKLSIFQRHHAQHRVFPERIESTGAEQPPLDAHACSELAGAHW